MSPLRKGLAKFCALLVDRGRRPLYNYNVDAAEHIKRAVDIPVIVVGGVRNLRDITEIVSAKDIDFVSLCRPFVIEPDIVRKFKQGTQESSRCIDCGYCLIGVTASPLKCYYGRLPRQ
jgi:2,4-dienoyl-CoA reductase-like NADH-dependent reductase (Old Yellow Enzyme family)